jgi:hypothetical protein
MDTDEIDEVVAAMFAVGFSRTSLDWALCYMAGRRDSLSVIELWNGSAADLRRLMVEADAVPFIRMIGAVSELIELSGECDGTCEDADCRTCRDPRLYVEYEFVRDIAPADAADPVRCAQLFAILVDAARAVGDEWQARDAGAGRPACNIGVDVNGYPLFTRRKPREPTANATVRADAVRDNLATLCEFFATELSYSMETMQGYIDGNPSDIERIQAYAARAPMPVRCAPRARRALPRC